MSLPVKERCDAAGFNPSGCEPTKLIPALSPAWQFHQVSARSGWLKLLLGVESDKLAYEPARKRPKAVRMPVAGKCLIPGRHAHWRAAGLCLPSPVLFWNQNPALLRSGPKLFMQLAG